MNTRPYKQHLQGQLIIAALDVVVASVEGHAPNMVAGKWGLREGAGRHLGTPRGV